MQDKQKKIKNNFINFLKENYKSIIFLALLIFIVNLDFPYYIEAPGGTINLTERIDKNYDRKKGSLNMLYVTNYKANVITDRKSVV